MKEYVGLAKLEHKQRYDNICSKWVLDPTKMTISISYTSNNARYTNVMYDSIDSVTTKIGTDATDNLSIAKDIDCNI